MSFETLRDGWFGWDMPAWIDLGNGSPLQQCRLKDLSNRHAKLSVSTAHALPDRFVLHLTASGSLPLACRVIARNPSMISVEFNSLVNTAPAWDSAYS
jgi:hypothetical protein